MIKCNISRKVERQLYWDLPWEETLLVTWGILIKDYFSRNTLKLLRSGMYIKLTT